MEPQFQHGLLYLMAAFSNRTVRWRSVRDERGQTSTEYLMIVGLMAAVILLAFVTFFWDTVKGAASEWAGKVADAVRGNQVRQ